MKYRPAQLTDCPALCLLEKQQPRAAQWGESGWEAELTNRAAYVLCAQEGEEIVGFVALRLAAGVCEILNVAVSPLYVRRGIGQELVGQCIKWVRQRGAEQITLEVGAANLPAICLYQKAGFVPVGVRKNFYPGNEDALILKLLV